ncbi:hypothetical protein D3C83_327770 [compost metagenome]
MIVEMDLLGQEILPSDDLLRIQSGHDLVVAHAEENGVARILDTGEPVRCREDM